MKRLTFFLPFRNEENSLEKSVRIIGEVAEREISDYEILLINDGSTDESPTIARRLAAELPKVRAIDLLDHRGFGAAFLRGLREARFPFVMYLPADGDVTTESLQRILSTWAGDGPLVQYQMRQHVRIWWRFLLSRLYTKIVQGISSTSLPYYNGNNILPTELVRKTDLFDFGFSTQAHVLLRLKISDLNPQLVGIVGESHDETSQSVTFRNVIFAARFISFTIFDRLRSSFSRNPLSR